MKVLRLHGSRTIDIQRAERDIRSAFSSRATPQIRPVVSREIQEELERWNAEESTRYENVSQNILENAAPLDLESPAVIPTGKKVESAENGYLNASWLREKCEALVARQDRHGMSGAEMALAAMLLLKDESKTDLELQGELFDALAGDFDAVVDVLSKRQELIAISDPVVADCTQVQELDMAGVDRQRGSRPPDTQAFGSTFSVVDAEQLERERRKRTLEKRARRSGLLTTAESGRLQGPGSAVKEVQKAFPGIQLDSTGLVGGPDRVALPAGSIKISGDGYEEVQVPPPRPVASSSGNLIKIVDEFANFPQALKAFEGITTLNRLQSAVYPMAFSSNENLLICAPTGAGKTNVAFLTILREVDAVKTRRQSNFKVVYVAPMKALAAEVVDKFSKKLGPSGLQVREYTGDMSLSRQEALETHILVTTPEKWDVVTRKAGSELSDTITLFIVDEIHLLHDERGSVLESIVARTLRLSEAAQRVIRLVGLSATLPNYKDVGSFMRVNPTRGLFYFDSSFRPVPLSQTFVGVTAGGTSKSSKAMKIRDAKMTQIAYDKVIDSLTRGHQAMIFVHSRKKTSATARNVLELAAKNAIENIFLGGDQAATSGEGEESLVDANTPPTWASREISRSKSKDVRDLCAKGIGIHHAGLPRVDRKLVEKLFAEGIIKLLCCTATLAWGVNLPVRSTIILGTEVYDSGKSAFVQLGMLDVTQIFGRAGRPQYDTFGEATIITTHEYLSHYLNLLTSAVPIESTLSSNASVLADHVNAETVSGTVTSIGSGVQWLSYTYLSVRMPLNPLAYGISWSEVYEDPSLHTRRSKLICSAAKLLDDARMARYDPRTGSIAPTDLGRVASHYYVSHHTIVLWNELLSGYTGIGRESDEHWEEIDSTIFHAIASASEFDQIRSREEEMKDLDALAAQCPVPVRAPPSAKEGKVAILLQAYISQIYIRLPDISYVTQSATRLLRALFEVCLRMGIPSLALASLELARASESRVWPFQHPLHQLVRKGRSFRSRSSLSNEALRALDNARENVDLGTLCDSPLEELIPIIGSRQHAAALKIAAKSLPVVKISSATPRPLSRTAIEVDIVLTPAFIWKDNLHGKMQSFWLWIEDQLHGRIYHSEQVLLRKGQTRMHMIVPVPVFDPPSPSYTIRLESSSLHTSGGSSWTLGLSDMHLPKGVCRYTKLLLGLRPLPIRSSLSRVVTARISSAGYPDHFGPAETQCFHRIKYCTGDNVLVLGIAEFGVLTMAEVAVLSAIDSLSKQKGAMKRQVVFIKGTKHGATAARERLLSFGVRAQGSNKDVIVTTAAQWYLKIRSLSSKALTAAVSSVIVDELHSICDNPLLEVVLTSVRVARNIRIVATGGVVAGAQEVADWLGVTPENFFVFDWSSRSVPIVRHVLGVAGDRYAARMATMTRMVYSAISNHGRNGSVIFVASKKQVRETAIGLRRLAAVDGNPERFVRVSQLSHNFDDWVLKEAVDSGIAFVHDGLSDRDARSVTQLVLSSSVNLLIATFDCADWECASSAGLVVVKGTDVYDIDQGRYVEISLARVLSLISRAGSRARAVQGHAVVLTEERRKTALKKFLFEPLCVESNIERSLPLILGNEIAQKRMHSFQDGVDYITWTYYFRRLLMNPSYYGIMKPQVTFERLCGHLSKVVERSLIHLVSNGIVGANRTNENAVFFCTTTGDIAVHAFLKPQSVQGIRNMFGANDASMGLLLNVVSSLDEFPKPKDRPRPGDVMKAIEKLVVDGIFRSREQAVEKLDIGKRGSLSGTAITVLEILLCCLGRSGNRNVAGTLSMEEVLTRGRTIGDFLVRLVKLDKIDKWKGIVLLFVERLQSR